MRMYWGALGVCVQRKLGFLEKALGVEFHPLGFCAGHGGAVGRWASGSVSLLIGHPAWRCSRKQREQRCGPGRTGSKASEEGSGRGT